MQTKKLAQLKQYIESADLALQQAREVLASLGGDKVSDKMAETKAKGLATVTDKTSNAKIVEGVFNGQNMIGPDGKEYSVPANYASKSKLVEGDIMKLTIQDDGSFLYKQIKPIDRERVKGEVVMDEITGKHSVLLPDSRKFDVLTASVTYFKGEPGDTATILVPKDKTATWAAIENIVKSNGVTPAGAPHELSSIDKKDDKPEEYQGLTQSAQKESILPDVDLQPAPAPNPTNPKSEAEREKIEEMINSDDGLDLDDLNKKDLDDL